MRLWNACCLGSGFEGLWFGVDGMCFGDVQRESHKGLPFFLYGESLGGAIAILIHLQQPELWQGIILNGAMCGIGKFKPP
ncbi:hypothetical protein KC19_3G094900 [Ceratodon purpureus]|uniref:Serine aminopeptidase S33 domain-containing protein n=1 Tax=Ceratodon purpureus TaxID=3225 RepID=A0A8T0IJC0_CERPU|nr:hypothetical protein KC19_3G094900 [Ceratodon purpureus]